MMVKISSKCYDVLRMVVGTLLLGKVVVMRGTDGD